jgi:hypothetical protein
MLNENFAERLFCDLRNANIVIGKPQYVMEGAKISDYPNSFQFNIMGIRGKYKSSEGIEVSIDNIEKEGLTFTEAYIQFLSKIEELEHVKFYSLVVPRRAVIEAKLEEFEKVVSRYIQDYLPATDQIAERWDVLVQKI